MSNQGTTWNRARRANNWSLSNLSEETRIRQDILDKILKNKITPESWHAKALNRVLKTQV